MPLGAALRDYWGVRTRFYEVGLLPTPNADPTGALGEAFVSAALWGENDPASAVVQGRECRWKTWDGWGPTLGSMPPTAGGRRNALAVDLAAPWTKIIQAVPGLAEFAQRRQGDRADWDRVWAEESGKDFPGTSTAYGALARVQVKARFTPSLTMHPDYDAVSFDLIRNRSVPDNDLFALCLFALRDEYEEDLGIRNFVGTCVLLTDECLRGLDTHGSGARLGWGQVHTWWDDLPSSMPLGAYDITPLLRAVRVTGWSADLA